YRVKAPLLRAPRNPPPQAAPVTADATRRQGHRCKRTNRPMTGWRAAPHSHCVIASHAGTNKAAGYPAALFACPNPLPLVPLVRGGTRGGDLLLTSRT